MNLPIAAAQLFSWLSTVVPHDPTVLVLAVLSLLVWMVHVILTREINRTSEPARASESLRYSKREN